MELNDRVIEATVGVAAFDQEFAIYSVGWTGSIEFVCGTESWILPVRNGMLGLPESTVDLQMSDCDFVVSAPPEEWSLLLEQPPSPGYVDFAAMTVLGVCTVQPLPATASHHNALRRLSELLRHAANDSDSSPVPASATSRHGEHESVVGHYIHLDLGSVDHRVYYESAGRGISLLCHHTAGSDARQWRHVLNDPWITSHFQVIAYDVPWHGKSLPPESRAWWAEDYRLTTETAMELPVALAGALRLERPVFLGSSMGGNLALDLARYHPDDFRAAIAVEGSLWIDLHGIEGYGSSRVPLLDPALHAATMTMVMSPTAPEHCRQETRFHYSEGAPGVFAGDVYYHAVDHDLRAQTHLFDTERCPVYLLTGEYDVSTVPGTIEAGARIKGSTFEIMKGLGHFPMVEDHHQFMRYLRPILEGIAYGAA
jgi:pimeloyl-ACP methyl ester carboxylesterase